jgi:uncharacterized protein with GYD domain
MATYMVLGSYTQQGIEGIKDRPARKERVMNRLKDNGCELIAGYMAMGRFDLVLMINAPNDAAVAKVVLGMGMSGNVSTETVRLFDDAEVDGILAAV